ncbi:hypothetical protein HDU87_001028 [Geranomyces variabilis]|uniref:ER membrane protein complex subunit 7 beta-sandwich domain-containing protein n=1 Tax=Geranomyces variabilis TaxID=109894 RepID=A0AAD5TN98_9FUNG|nr:hypothetical protein HDU87_001028 [Geranomyces variabilis]
MVEPREGFNFMSLLSNPMLLMSGFSMILFFVLPKLMSNLPQEEEPSKDAPPQEVPQLPSMPDISQNLANWFAPQAKPSSKKY